MSNLDHRSFTVDKGRTFSVVVPDGLFVAQDGDNRPQTQNFKYLGWAEIRKALGL